MVASADVDPTYLYPLEPIGRGKPFIQSLTGYVSDLAREHSLSMYDIVSKVILETIGSNRVRRQNGSLSIVWADLSECIDGMGLRCQQWVAALQELTGQNDLRFLTTLPLSNVINSSNLIRHSHMWCSQCFQDWYNENRRSYIPLLWRIKVVTYCPLHEVPLTEICPNPACARMQLPISRHPFPDFCAYCNSWLADSRVISHGLGEADEGLYAAKETATLLNVAQTASTDLSNENIYARCFSRVTRVHMTTYLALRGFLAFLAGCSDITIKVSDV